MINFSTQNYAERLALAAKLKAQQNLDIFGVSPKLEEKTDQYSNIGNLANKPPSPIPSFKDEKEAKRLEYEESLANARKQMWEERIALKKKSSVYLAQDMGIAIETQLDSSPVSNSDEEIEIKLLTAQLTAELSDESISAFVTQPTYAIEEPVSEDDDGFIFTCISIYF